MKEVWRPVPGYKHYRTASGERSIYWNKGRNRWEVNLRVNGKTLHFGRFIEFYDAVKARDKADRIHNDLRRLK